MSGATLDAVLAAALEPVVREAVRAELADFAPAEPRPALLDAESLARELSCCSRTVSKLVGEGLPHVKLGDARRFELAAVLGWLRSREGSK